MSQLNVIQQIAEFESGKYNNPAVLVQIEAGWYDWFCKDASLPGKTRKLYSKVKQLIKTKRIQQLDLNQTYVWFKNNCPVNGRLYDDIRFADIKTGEVLFTIIPKSGHNSESQEPSQVHGNRLTPAGEFQYDSYTGKDWRNIIQFLNQ